MGGGSATARAWLTGGESLHNNHHAYPSSPKFSMARFEFDPARGFRITRSRALPGVFFAGRGR